MNVLVSSKVDNEGAMAAIECVTVAYANSCCARAMIDYLSHAQMWMLMEGATKMQKHLTVAEPRSGVTWHGATAMDA